MADETQVEDIDGPVDLKKSAIAAAAGRVGVSKKGLRLGFVIGLAVVAMVAFGVMEAGTSGSSGDAADAAATDMPGQNQAFSVGKAIAEAGANKPAPPAVGGLQVRGEKPPTPNAGVPAPVVATGPSAQQSPAEQYKVWLEKKKYERLEGLELAHDSALTAKLTKGSGAAANSSGAGASTPYDPSLAPTPAAVSAYASAARRGLAATGVPGLDVGALPAALASGRNPAVAAQSRNRAFMKEVVDAGYLPESVKPRLGAHELSAGSIIPAVMLTGINSDLPGTITAQVRQTVYDSFNPNVVIIPQGARLVGRYSSQVATGQNRVLVAWDELILPDGDRLKLAGMSGADGVGQAGFGDQVDNHFWKIWGSALMVSLLGVGVQLSQPQQASYTQVPTAGQQAAGAAASSLNQAGSKVMEKNLNVSPTLTIRPGYVFNVIVNKSIILPAYHG